jgi:hypothetical protein
MLVLAALVLAQAAGAPTRDVSGQTASRETAPSRQAVSRPVRQRVCTAVRVDPLHPEVTGEQEVRDTTRSGSTASREPDVFSATKVHDLRVTAFLRPEVQGTHRLEFRLYAPSGNLYQILGVPFTVPVATDTARDTTDTLSGVSAKLPVSGTAITNNSLYGRWRVDAHVDGSTTPCGPSLAFTIEH